METKSHFITFYYVKTDMRRGHLEIEVQADKDGTNVLFYVSLVLILVAGVAIIYATIVLIRHFCCKNQQTITLNPFLEEQWVLQAETRYNNILKESPEGLYTKATSDYEQPKCVICLVEFAENQPIRTLACRHIFHKNCIEEWIKAKINDIPKCPSCNSDLTKERPLGYMEPGGNQVASDDRGSSSNLIPPATGETNGRGGNNC